jgi:hypothetical protein
VGRGRWLVVPVVLGLAGASCAPVVSGGADAAAARLATSLNVRVPAADSVHFELHVTNVAATPTVLEFATAQRYDFAVATADGQRIWRWSEQHAFAQVLGTETLAPGETRRYDAVWRPGGWHGELVVEARLTALNEPVALSTVVLVPGR